MKTSTEGLTAGVGDAGWGTGLSEIGAGELELRVGVTASVTCGVWLMARRPRKRRKIARPPNTKTTMTTTSKRARVVTGSATVPTC